ncbi:MAG: serine hydrolase domain-containing protein [Dehalococcoidia bacterium]
MVAINVYGTIAAGWEPVQIAFGETFTQRGDVGASLSVVVDGRCVVDLWGGYTDASLTREWAEDTIVNVFSTTKGITAIAAAMLVDRGLLDVDQLVTRYWPEFGQAGKQNIPVKWLLSHQAGLPVVDEAIPIGGALDWATMIGLLEAQAPVWEPGTKMGYHAVTYGWLVGEVIRRITGKSVGAFVQDEIARPLGVDFYVGMPASEDRRTASMIPQAGGLTGAMDPTSLAARSLGIASPPAGAEVNSREWRAAELPAANGHTNGGALAQIYGCLARGGEMSGVHLLGPGAIAQFATEQVAGDDAVIGIQARRGLGFILSSPGGRYHWGPNPRSFGHSGAGGSLGFADPDAKLGFGYAMNKMASGLSADPRWAPLIDAAYACL